MKIWDRFHTSLFFSCILDKGVEFSFFYLVSSFFGRGWWEKEKVMNTVIKFGNLLSKTTLKHVSQLVTANTQPQSAASQYLDN